MRSRLIAAAVLALAVPLPSAWADDVSEPIRYAVFTGTASPRTGGVAATCFEIIPANPAVASRTCTAMFEITVAGGVCDVTAGTHVGWFNYTSHTTGLSFVNMPLSASAAGGSAYLYGTLLVETRVLHVRISTASLCGDGATGPFEGHLAYV